MQGGVQHPPYPVRLGGMRSARDVLCNGAVRCGSLWLDVMPERHGQPVVGAHAPVPGLVVRTNAGRRVARGV